MPRQSLLLLTLLAVLAVPRLHADIGAINASALPQESAVLAALDDAKQLEPYTSSWSPNWQYPIPKDQAAARLSKDLGFLNLAAKNHPDNAELLLLTGLVASYAYNVDVSGSNDTVASTLAQAQKLAPSDFRAPWFTATFQCETNALASGANGFLSIESSHPWNQLPVAFWEDYMRCAMVANMPAHTLRAASYTQNLNAPASAWRTSIVDLANKRFDPYDPTKTYATADVWQGAAVGSDTMLTSTTCGVRMHAQNTWAVNQMGLSDGSCVAYFGTGPYQAVTTSLHPSILVLVQQATANETLQDFAKKFETNGTFQPDPTLKCPAPDCIALNALQPGMYKADGDGHGRVLVFERDQPEFPGLIFESPQAPPVSQSGSAPVAYTPSQTQERIPGKLFYLVLLDTASSIEGPALKDYEFFLRNLTAE
jgi:hypothetical protein